MRKILLTGMSGTGEVVRPRRARPVGIRLGFDAAVLLHAPAEVLLRRIALRTTNDYGKRADERDSILRELAEVEPLLRATCTHEVDATRPLDVVVAELVAIGTGAES